LHKNKVKVAVARELAAFIWELAVIMKEKNIYSPIPSVELAC